MQILWVDDEIELLEPHIMMLEEKGYPVTRVTNGHDAIERVKKERYDLVFLDEQMPGMNGLATLEEIKQIVPDLEVVMVTKSEEEHIMDDAIGSQISDYLIKPVHPTQVFLTCKRLLEKQRIRGERVSKDYLQSFGQISAAFSQSPTWQDWLDIYLRLSKADREMEGDDGLRQVLGDQQREANQEFGRYIERVYPQWMEDWRRRVDTDRPILSPDVVPQFVLKHIGNGRPVFFFVIDCMRYDQWLEMERLLYPLFEIEKDFYSSILPTATPYSRNAIFSGLLPDELARRYAEWWNDAAEDEHSKNRHEEQLLADLLRRKNASCKLRYEKVVKTSDGKSVGDSINNMLENDLNAIVVNFVDNLAHGRSDSPILKEIAPDERAYRALTLTWFEHSWLYETFQNLARQDCTIVVTTDHGVIRSLRPSKVIGDRETSTSLRYKVGRNLKCDTKQAIHVKEPELYGLPRAKLNTHYIIAREDYYFVYPTNYNHYVNYYRDTMQHGGVSMEEMILPVITLNPT
jgi:CheY-like chemotaxis protein